MGKTKKKLNKMTIAIITLSVALIVAIGGIFGVYAASQQNVGASFSVQYSIGKNVAVAIGAKAVNASKPDNDIWFESSNSNLSTPNATTNLYEIPVSSNNVGLNLSLPSENNGVLEVDAWYNQYILFFSQNLSDKDLKVTISDNCERTGDFAVSYIHGIIEDPTDTNDIMGSVETLDEFTNGFSYVVEPGEIYCFIVMIYVRMDVNKSASYTSSANKGIAFIYEQA